MDKRKRHFILDLDQTVISSEKPSKKWNETTLKKFGKGNSHNMDNIYTVVERPHLQEFLDFLFKNFQVSVWTAATKDYALFIIDRVILKDPKRSLNFMLFDYHCDRSKRGIKDLSLLWRDNLPFTEHNCVILDDNLGVYRAQPNNCIRAPPFYFLEQEAENDTFLKELIKCLKGKQDVKAINKKFKELL